MTEYLNRDILSAVIEALGEMPVVVLTGMRQTGKTTFLQTQPEFHGRRYVTFDDFAQLEAAKRDPEGFVDTEELLTIDEVQRCPEILIAIKRAVDRKRVAGKYLLSGSANLSMLKNVSESLAGRAVYFVMHPLSRRELAGLTKQKPFIRQFFEARQLFGTEALSRIVTEAVMMGGMPSVCIGEVKNRFLWFKGYEQTYLERDLREFGMVENIISFRTLLHLSALRTGQLLNISQLGRDAKLTAATAGRYLSLLEASFIGYRLNPYLGNQGSRLIKSSKLYLSDSGLAGYLSGLDKLDALSDEPQGGALFETYVAQNISSIIDSGWHEARLFFWTLQGRHEVDFIIEAGRACLAVEVKSGGRWSDRDLSGLKAFLDITPHCTAAVLAYNGVEAVKLGEKLWAIPLNMLLS